MRVESCWQVLGGREKGGGRGDDGKRGYKFRYWHLKFFQFFFSNLSITIIILETVNSKNSQSFIEQSLKNSYNWRKSIGWRKSHRILIYWSEYVSTFLIVIHFIHSFSIYSHKKAINVYMLTCSEAVPQRCSHEQALRKMRGKPTREYPCRSMISMELSHSSIKIALPHVLRC